MAIDTFLNEARRIKAKVITIGRPGEEVKFVASKPKSVFEFNTWVLAHKFKVSTGVISIMILGAILGQVGLWSLSAGLITAFIASMIFTKPCP